MPALNRQDLIQVIYGTRAELDSVGSGNYPEEGEIGYVTDEKVYIFGKGPTVYPETATVGAATATVAGTVKMRTTAGLADATQAVRGDDQRLKGFESGGNTNSSPDAIAIGYFSDSQFGGVALGYESVTISGVAIGQYAKTDEGGISIGPSMSSVGIPRRVEIGTFDPFSQLKSRISGQVSTRNWQFTAAQTDTAPTAAADALGNAEGTLPRGMFQIQANAAETALTVHYTTMAGVVKSATIPLA